MEHPQQRVPRRTRLQGGFLISPETAIEWANRIEPSFTLTKDDMSVVWQFIEERVAPKGFIFSTVGEEDETDYMVVTQKKRFNGYLGMDPSLIPQFVEGEREAQLLDAEGVADYQFATILG